MPRLFSTTLLLSCVFCLASPAAAALAPIPWLSMEPRAGAGWGEPRTGPSMSLRSGDRGSLERLSTSIRIPPTAQNALEADPPLQLWGSPLQLSWSGSGPVRCNAALAASYAVPEITDTLPLEEVLDSERFRAWLRSELQWHCSTDAVLVLDARWSPAGLAGVDSSPPFQAAATVTVPW